jgi:cyclopropane fatty-acyl-phospholipid synthase-like methyltransferase
MTGVREVLDVGGASGTLLMALLAEHPEARGTILELPNTAAEARRVLRERGYDDRIEVVEGNFHECSYGEGFDIVFFSNIFHLCTETECAKLVRRSAEALRPGGRLIIKDMIGREDGSETPGLAMYSILMLLISRGGRLHSESRYRQWFEAAGLAHEQRIDCWERSSILIGRKKSSA